MSGMGSLPLLPLAMEEADADPPLRMHELKSSLYLPLDTLAWYPRGSNLFCRGSDPPLAIVYGPRAYEIFGGVGVPKLRRVTSIGALVPPYDGVPSTIGLVVPV